MKKLVALLAGALAIVTVGAMPAHAGTGTYDANTGIVTIVNGPDDPFGSSYEGTSTVPVEDGTVVSFQWKSDDVSCGGGVPRLFIQGGAYNTFDGNPDACGTDAGDGWSTVTETLSGFSGTVGHFGLVNDNPSNKGTVQFRNVTVDGVSLLPPLAPQNKDQCKDGGWQNGAYKNQGECVSRFAKTK